MAALPETPRPGPVVIAPQAPNGSSTPWIVVGPRTRAQMALQLERAFGVVLLALLETSGVPDGQAYRLVLEAAHLEPVRETPPGEAPAP